MKKLISTVISLVLLAATSGPVFAHEVPRQLVSFSAANNEKSQIEAVIELRRNGQPFAVGESVQLRVRVLGLDGEPLTCISGECTPEFLLDLKVSGDGNTAVIIDECLLFDFDSNQLLARDEFPTESGPSTQTFYVGDPQIDNLGRAAFQVEISPVAMGEPPRHIEVLSYSLSFSATTLGPSGETLDIQTPGLNYTLVITGSLP